MIGERNDNALLEHSQQQIVYYKVEVEKLRALVEDKVGEDNKRRESMVVDSTRRFTKMSRVIVMTKIPKTIKGSKFKPWSLNSYVIWSIILMRKSTWGMKETKM